MNESTPQVAPQAEAPRCLGDGESSCQKDSPAEVAGSLMNRMARGDESALEELVTIHGQMLARLIGRLTGWHGDSDDIFQEVLLTAWRRSKHYREGGSCEAWLKRIAVNRVKNHYRALSRWQRKLEQIADRLASREQPQAIGFVEETREPMHLAMQKMRASDRALIVLVYLEELPMAEVAEIVGVRPSALHVRLHRARARLKKLLLQQDSECENE